MKRFLLLTAALAVSTLAFSQAFVPGNLVISRYGDGKTTLPTNNRTVPVFLDEYDLAGQKIQTLALPASENSGGDEESNNRILTGAPKFKDEGLITLSPNGYFLSLVGYNLEANTTQFNNQTFRTIGVITPDGAIDTRTGARVILGRPRCAITNNGANFWYVGSGSGLRRKTLGSGNQADSVILNPPTGYNSVYILNDQLYYTTDNAEGPKISRVGASLPYAEQTTSTPLPGYTNTGSPNQMIMLDNDVSTPEPDLLYVTDSEAGSLQKWVFTGNQWVARGAVILPGVTTDISGITGEITSGNVVLYAVTPGSLLKINDEAAISTTVSATTHTPVVLVQAPAKTQFRGVAFTPGTIKEKPFVDVSSREFASLIQQKTNLIKELKSNVTTHPYPGIEETHISYINQKGSPVALFFLKVNLSNPNVTIEAGTPNNNSKWALQKVSEMIPYKNEIYSDRQVVAASNGDYFEWWGEPEGGIHKNDTVIKALPDNMYFFSIREDGTALIGDKRIYRSTASALKEMISGRFYLMHYGETMTEHLFDKSIEPRSTVGVLSPERVVFMWVDGRRTGHSGGISLTDMAYIYKAIGATDAINLDGGGSTTFIMREKNGSYTPHNKPSDATGERKVANSLMVLLKSNLLKSGPKQVSNPPATLVAQPNPVSTQVTLTLDAATKSQQLAFRLSDKDGMTVYDFTGSLTAINDELNRRLKDLKEGIYIATITHGKHIYSTRFVKE
ncbi:MAG TPA: phosphodiester glycosidase family protein [Chitinophagaceae bacterium]